MQFWEGVASKLELRYTQQDSITKILLRVEDQVHYLREVHCCREFINTKGEEIACRIFVNYDKMKAAPGEKGKRLNEVSYSLAGGKAISAHEPAVPKGELPPDFFALFGGAFIRCVRSKDPKPCFSQSQEDEKR